MKWAKKNLKTKVKMKRAKINHKTNGMMKWARTKVMLNFKKISIQFKIYILFYEESCFFDSLNT